MEKIPNILIYSKENCAYCQWAKQFFDAKQLKYTEIRVDLHPDKLAEMIQIAARRTTPQIVINNKAIGGYDDLIALSKSGELTELLKN